MRYVNEKSGRERDRDRQRERETKKETQREQCPGNQVKNRIIKVERVIHFGKSAESDMEVVLSYINENSFQGICEYVHVLQMVMGLLRCDCRELKANRGRKGLETVSLTSYSRSFAKREQIIEVVASRASIGPPENREKDRIRRKGFVGSWGKQK